MDADVIIAGAGVAGLACAANLADCGLRVRVFERDPWPGGRAASWTDEVTGDTVDIGPHVLTTEHLNFLALLRRLGTATDLLWQPEPLVTLYDRGRLIAMHASRLPPPLHGLPNLRNTLRCVSLRDALSNLRIAWQAARLDEADTLALDRQDALTLLQRQGVSPRFIRWFWEPAMLSLLNVPLSRCSAAAMMRVFRLMLGRSGYCFGFARHGLADLFVPGCVRRITAAGGAVELASPVEGLIVSPQGLAGFRLADGREIRAPAGVLAVPPQDVGRLTNDHDGVLGRLATRAAAFDPCPYVSTMLWFDRKLGPYRFWARSGSQVNLNTDFYDLANIRDANLGKPSLIVSNTIHARESWTWDDARIIERTRAEVCEALPAAAAATLRHARVHRIPMAVACPAPGTESLRPAVRTGLPGLWLAGDWTTTGLPCSMESAARSAALVSAEIAAGLGKRAVGALPRQETTALVGLLRRRRPLRPQQQPAQPGSSRAAPVPPP
jgi:phytoene dehydrogenase-like protein